MRSRPVTHRSPWGTGPATAARAAAALPLLLALGLVAGCGGADRDATGTVTAAGQEDAFALAVGDCVADPALNGDDTTEVSDVGVVPCSDPHDTEVFAVFDLADGEYPGDETVTTDADQGCYKEFATFVGVTYEESELDYYFLTPTQESWNAIDDREVACLVGLPGEQVTGSLQGSDR
jgi:hypothetical protein